MVRVNTAVKGIMQCLQEHIETCPLLEESQGLFTKVDMDVLEEDSGYMITRVPVETKIKTYLDGSGIYQEAFVFAGRHFYDADENIDTNAFYDGFSEWLRESKSLLILPAGMEVMKLEATTSGYVFDTEYGRVQYRIPCRLEYYKKGD